MALKKQQPPKAAPARSEPGPFTLGLILAVRLIPLFHSSSLLERMELVPVSCSARAKLGVVPAFMQYD